MKALDRKSRLIENEVIFRDVNKNIKDFLKGESGIKNSEPMSFYCECSAPNCIERISLTLKEYEDLHKDTRHFVVLIGHDFPEVEKVLMKKSDYQVVEKHIAPPKAKDINLALKSISSSISST